MKQWEKGQVSLTLTHILYSTHTFPPASVHLSLCGNPSLRLQVYSIRRSLPGGLHHFITQRLMYRAFTSQHRLSTTCEPANYSHSLERSRRPVGGLRGSERRNAASELKVIKLQRTRCRHWALEIIQYLGAWEEDTCMCRSTCDILWHAVRFTALVSFRFDFVYNCFILFKGRLDVLAVGYHRVTWSFCWVAIFSCQRRFRQLQNVTRVQPMPRKKKFYRTNYRQCWQRSPEVTR